jgi:hypothetical protein
MHQNGIGQFDVPFLQSFNKVPNSYDLHTPQRYITMVGNLQSKWLMAERIIIQSVS